MLEDLWLEDVDAGVDRVAESFLDTGLFLKDELVWSSVTTTP